MAFKVIHACIKLVCLRRNEGRFEKVDTKAFLSSTTLLSWSQCAIQTWCLLIVGKGERKGSATTGFVKRREGFGTVEDFVDVAGAVVNAPEKPTVCVVSVVSLHEV